MNNKKMLKHCALAAIVVAVFAVGDVASPAMAQVGPYYAYAPGYYAYALAPGGPWGAIVGNSNPSVPFDPPAAAFDLRYGKSYGFCQYMIAGC